MRQAANVKLAVPVHVRLSAAARSDAHDTGDRRLRNCRRDSECETDRIGDVGQRQDKMQRLLAHWRLASRFVQAAVLASLRWNFARWLFSTRCSRS
jgi:hypothetical protein